MIVDTSGYLGFTYNGKHSSEFNIVRVSDGSRFNQNLLPTIQDKTTQVPGAPGRIFQRTDYDTRVLSVQIAYDNMSEKNLQDMRKWLGDKRVHPLVFDELPYKTWYAKVTGTASMKWIPFKEGETNRTYKGEGTIQFTCFDPFAHCKHDWDYTKYENYLEWLTASGLEKAVKDNNLSIVTTEQTPATIDVSQDKFGFQISSGLLWSNTSLEIINGYLSAAGLKIDDKLLVLDGQGTGETTKYSSVTVRNVGDVDTDFYLDISTTGTSIPSSVVLLTVNDGTQAIDTVVGLFAWEKLSDSNKVKINSKIQLIEELNDSNEKSGTIYDISTGAYFKIPKQDSESESTYKLWLCSKEDMTATLSYDYLYF